jgi:hypothetical protein
MESPDLWKRYFALPTIDTTAESFDSRFFFSILLVTTVIFATSFYALIDLSKDCRDEPNMFGCLVGSGMWTWFAVFLQFGLLGASIVFLASSGNSLTINVDPKDRGRSVKVAKLFLGILVIFIIFVLPLTMEKKTGRDPGETFLFFNRSEERPRWAVVLTLSFGAVLFVLQISMIWNVFCPKYAGSNLRERTFPGIQKVRQLTKVAASKKMHRFILQAMEVHVEPRMLPGSTTFQEAALVRFQSKINGSESVGGIIWAWKQFFNRSFQETEG